MSDEPLVHPSGAYYATWWTRFGAEIIDALILAIPSIVIFLLFNTLGRIVFGAAIGIAYNGLLDGGPSGQTVGKRVLGIRTIDDATGDSIGTNRGFGRAAFVAALQNASIVLRFGAGLLVILDGLWAAWDAKRQTWHDKVVGSVVVVASS